MVRVGIIGLGMMGRMHAAAWEGIEGAELVAVADTDPARAGGDLSEGWSNISGGAESLDMTRIRGTTDPHVLVAMEDVDLVDVCVPTPYHNELAEAALMAGKHCICEKPLARTAEQADEIASAAEAAPGLLLPAMCMRFWPEWAWLKRMIERESYGRVIDATFRRVGGQPGGWFADGNASGGAILDLHLHDTDFIRFAFGQPEAVRSFGLTRVTGCVDHVVTHYLYGDNGPMVTAEGGWGMAAGFPFQMNYCVNFERATAEYRMLRDVPLVVYKDGKAVETPLEDATGYVNELAYMVQCIESGEAPSVVTAADAAASIRVVEAEARSVETGEAVTL